MATNYEWLLHMDGEERQAWFDAEHVDNTKSAKRAAAVERVRKAKDAGTSIGYAIVGREYYPWEAYETLIELLTDDDGLRNNDGVAAEHGATRMTNLERLFVDSEQFRQAVSAFAFAHSDDCPTSPTQMVDWLMAPYVDAHSKPHSKTEQMLTEQSESLSDDLGHPTDMSQKSADCVRNDGKMSETGVSANDVDANDENTTQDSREKLEDKAFNLIARMVNEAYTMGAHEADWSVNRQSVRNCITELFDGVAAITRKTEQAAWIQQANGLIHEANVRADELQDTVESLKAERDYWRTWYLNIEHDNSVLQAKVDELRDELAKRDKGIARLKRQRDEARRELTDSREYLNGWDIGSVVDLLKQYESNKLMRDCDHETLSWIDNEKLHAQVDRLEAERDALAADLRDCERQRERLRQALGCAIDHAHEVVSLVNLDGEVIG